MSEKFPEEFVGKLSRTVLHAAEKDRRNLFNKLTAKNANLIAEAELEKPVFHKTEKGREPEIYLDEEIAVLLPKEFFENPTAWIENQADIHRPNEDFMGEDKAIYDLWGEPYDTTKVKEFSLTKPDGEEKSIVSKRIDSKQTAEVARAKQAYDASIPTPKVLGEILDQGNIYAWFEKLEGVNLNSLWQKFYAAGKREVFDFNLRFKSRLDYELLDDFLKKDTLFPSESLRNEIRELINEAGNASSDISLLEDMVHDINPPNNITPPRHGYSYQLVIERDNIMKSESVFFKGYERFLKDNPLVEKLWKEVINIYRSAGATIEPILEEHEAYYPTNPKVTHIVEPLLEKIFSHHKEVLDRIVAELKEESVRLQRLKDNKTADIKRKLQETHLGIDLAKEKDHLKQMCEEKGIPHKDFADRNLVLLWDKENDRPPVLEPGKPRLYIIDWEEEKSPSKNPKATT